MAKLPRITRPRRRSRAGEVVPRAEPRLTELSANGLTWINLSVPDAAGAEELAERFEWHPLDIEDVLSKRQRPKIDEYPDYLFVVLHFPVYDKAVQRLNAAELDLFLGHGYLVTLPNVELLPVTRLFQRCEDDESLREDLFSKGSGYLLYHVLDDLFDYCFPILDKMGHKLDTVEDEMFEGRAEEVVRDLSNVKQEIISYRKIIKPERTTLRALERRTERFLPEELDVYFDDIVDSAERIWDLPRQLQGSRRGPRVDERVGDLAPAQRGAARAHGLHRASAAVDADREPVRDERRLPRRGHGRGVLGDPRADGGRDRRTRGVFPLEALALSVSAQRWRIGRLCTRILYPEQAFSERVLVVSEDDTSGGRIRSPCPVRLQSTCQTVRPR